MLEQTAGAVSSGLGPPLQLAEFAAQREVAEEQEGRAAVAVGARERDADGAVLAVEFEIVAVVRPEARVERAVVDHARGEALAVDHILQPHDVLDRLAVASLPAELDANEAGLGERLGPEVLSRPAGIFAERPDGTPDVGA